MNKLEADLEDHDKEISMLKDNREKTLYDLAEMQTTISEKTKKLSSATESIADLELKLTTLKESLESSRVRKKTLTKVRESWIRGSSGVGAV